MRLKSLIPIGREQDKLSLREFNPFAALQGEVERLFDDFSRGLPAFGSKGVLPSTDVTETDKEIQVTAELPGLEEKDVQINFADDVLTISGEKKAEKEEKDENYRVVERSYGSFSRSLQLPRGIDPDSIKASMAKGVLKVTVPKPTPAVAKKIDVKKAA
jgi:HSP20 family protein